MVPTDHWLVSVNYVPKDAPYIENGHWTWPLHQLGNQDLLKEIDSLSIQFLSDIDRIRIERTDRNIENPQTPWKNLKEAAAKAAKAKTKKTYHKIHL